MGTAMGLARRAGWNVIDQVMSALSNMLLMILVARSVDETSFGAFSFGFVIYGVGIAVAKALVGQPLQMRHSNDAPATFRSAVARSQGTAAWVGLLGAALCVAVGLVISGPIGPVLVALAPCLPALLMQDSCRMAFFASGRAHHAALIDFVRMVLQFAFLFAALAAGWDSVAQLTLTWGLAGLVSATVGLFLLRATPSLLRAREWMSEQRDITGYLFFEYLLGLGAAQFGILLIAPLSSPADVGAIRAVQTLLGPLNVLGTAAFAFAIPEISRRAGMRARSRVLAMVGVSGVMGTIATTYVLVLLFLPEPVGAELFGDSWTGAATVLLPMGINSISAALSLGAAVSLYGMGLARTTFRLNVARAPLLLGLMVWWTLESGAIGAAWALATVETLFLPWWAWAAWRNIHRRDAELGGKDALPHEG